MARKGKFDDWLTDEGETLIAGWARNGLSEPQIAHNMGISYSTFKEWKKRFPTISAVIKKSREVVDLEVENALYRKAIGFTTEEVTEEYTEGGKKHVKKITRHTPGDTVAQIFWLKNRKPDKWRDKPDYTAVEAYEDDGLIAALAANAENGADDDSWMIEGGEHETGGV